MSELPMGGLISVDEAIAILDAVPVTPRTERVALARAMGRRLAEEVRADADAPPFEKALMDGYAVRAADVAAAGAQLRVIETIAAGVAGRRTLGAGEAAAIMTGAPLPVGADAVVPVEQTTREGNGVTIRKAVRAGEAIAHRGSDVARGAVVLPAGGMLNPAAIAVAASVGAAELAVFAKPTVAVIATGDELVEMGQTPGGPQIRNSNGPMLASLLERLGCEVRNLGIVRDERAVIREVLERALSTADAVFVTGGMSMGQFDYVPELMQALGLELKIRKLRIKPGKPFAFASGGGRMMFGLPGNPVSAFVCTVRLASRVLARMGGGAAGADVVEVPVDGELPANGPREFYQPAVLRAGQVRPLPWKGSADIYTLAEANALIIRTENAPTAVAGTRVPVLML